MSISETSLLPAGFTCSGVRAGIKSNKKIKDLGLIFCEHDAILGGVYTTNQFPSIHIGFCQPKTPSNRFRALIVNSGNANASTGLKGEQANKAMADELAMQLKIKQNQVFTSSTGIIGHPMPIGLITPAINPLVNGLGDNPKDFAEAILTTDTCIKTAETKITLSGKDYKVFGFAKGSGMVHPNMATMLAYILTDAPIPFTKIQKLTKQSSDKSFNRISVDGDTSTNDTYFLISSNPVQKISKDNLNLISEAVEKVAVTLAKKVVQDGEGAEHLIECKVFGAPSQKIADLVSREITLSNLVKTAVHGRDPNWGRILMAAGNGLHKANADKPVKLSVSIQSVPVLAKGEPLCFDEKDLSKRMEEFDVQITVNINQGNHQSISWGCDLSREYIAINADYST